MDVREIQWEIVYWILLSQDKDLMDSFGHGNEPSGSIKGRRFIFMYVGCMALFWVCYTTESDKVFML
jgi:hypothetical protein